MPDADWNDWRWQLRTGSPRSRDCRSSRRDSSAENARRGVAGGQSKLALAITPYFFNLIDPEDPECRPAPGDPRIEETRTAPWEMSDPVGRIPIPRSRDWFTDIRIGS